MVHGVAAATAHADNLDGTGCGIGFLGVTGEIVV